MDFMLQEGGSFGKAENLPERVERGAIDDVLGQGAKAEKLRQQGKFVIGGTTYTDKLEDDRAFGQDELKKAGVPEEICAFVFNQMCRAGGITIELMSGVDRFGRLGDHIPFQSNGFPSIRFDSTMR